MRVPRWLFCVLVIVGIGVACVFAYPSFAKSRFTTTWIRIFRQLPAKSGLAPVPASYRPDLLFVRDFPDGSWVAARSECTDDEDFNAAVFVDSSHSIRTSDHHFCGYEGLSVELSEPSAANLGEFYARLAANKIDLHPVR